MVVPSVTGISVVFVVEAKATLSSARKLESLNRATSFIDLEPELFKPGRTRVSSEARR